MRNKKEMIRLTEQLEDLTTKMYSIYLKIEKEAKRRLKTTPDLRPREIDRLEEMMQEARDAQRYVNELYLPDPTDDEVFNLFD